VAKEWDLTQWANLAAGFRLSYYSAFGSGYNPEISLNFPLGKWALKTSISALLLIYCHKKQENLFASLRETFCLLLSALAHARQNLSLDTGL
jgi:hypothetical protein